MSIGAVVLAAGASRRLGRPKQLVRYKGGTLLGATARVALDVADRVAVVVGAHREVVVPALASLPVTVVDNPAWEEGMASSLRRGVAWATAAGVETLLLLVCDQPRLGAGHLRRLLDARAHHGGAAASGYGGGAGVPAAVGRELFPALASLTGDRGARAVLRDAPRLTVIDWPQGALDVDTVAEVAALEV